jgi:hypothetical protein
MKTYSEAELQLLRSNWQSNGCFYAHDNDGQVIVYTNVFAWKDGSYRDEPDPSYNDEDDL